MFLSLPYLVFLHITLLVPGYVTIKKTKLLSKDSGVELATGYLVSIFFFALLSTLDYVVKLSPEFSRIVCWGVLGVCLVEFIRARYYRDILKLRFPLICFFVMSLFATAFLGLTFNSQYSKIPDPTAQAGANYNTLNVKVLNVAQTQANDNYVPYRQAQFFLNRSDPGKDSFIGEWGVGFFERTPLMGAVTANYLNLFNEKVPINFLWSPTSHDPSHTYLQFQLLAHVLNMLFIVPGFFLLIKLFNKRTAVITCLFLITSQFFLYNAIFSWPKSFVAFFILLSLLLLLEEKRRYVVFAGVASGLAYLTHDLAILYIGATILFLIYQRRFKDMLIYTGIPVIFAVPWLYAADIYYKTPSSFIYYPISTRGIPQPQLSKQITQQFLRTSPLRLIKIRLDNIFYLLTPYQFISSEGGQALGRRVWADGLFNIPGAVGVGLIIPALIAFLKRLRGIGFWILVLVPILLESIFIGWPKGLGALHFAEPVVVLVSGLGIFYLTRLKNHMWLFLAFAANCIQLAFFVAYSYKFTTGGWLTNPKDILILATMAAITLLCGWFIYRASKDNKTRLSDSKLFDRLGVLPLIK